MYRKPNHLTREAERWLYGPRSEDETSTLALWLAGVSMALGLALAWLYQAG